MLRRKRAKIGVGHEIACRLRPAQHPRELSAMLPGRVDGADERQIEPFVKVRERSIER